MFRRNNRKWLAALDSQDSIALLESLDMAAQVGEFDVDQEREKYGAFGSCLSPIDSSTFTKLERVDSTPLLPAPTSQVFSSDLELDALDLLSSKEYPRFQRRDAVEIDEEEDLQTISTRRRSLPGFLYAPEPVNPTRQQREVALPAALATNRRETNPSLLLLNRDSLVLNHRRRSIDAGNNFGAIARASRQSLARQSRQQRFFWD